MPVCGAMERIFRQASTPSSPGILISNKTRSNGRRWRSPTASLPVPASSTAKPPAVSEARITLHSEGSSSTTRMLKTFAELIHPTFTQLTFTQLTFTQLTFRHLSFMNRVGHAKCDTRIAGWFAVQFKVPAVRDRDLARDEQAQARSSGHLSRVHSAIEPLKDVRSLAGRNGRSGTQHSQ